MYLPNLGEHEEALLKGASSLHTEIVGLSSANGEELLAESMEPITTNPNPTGCRNR